MELAEYPTSVHAYGVKYIYAQTRALLQSEMRMKYAFWLDAKSRSVIF
jgi:hypothetical protein